MPGENEETPSSLDAVTSETPENVDGEPSSEEVNAELEASTTVETQDKTVIEADFAIIGTGLSLSYAAYLLKKLHPTKKIVLFEREERVGGRHSSSTCPKWVKADFHSEFIHPTSQKYVSRLLDDLGDNIESKKAPGHLSTDLNYGIDAKVNVEKALSRFLAEFPRESKDPKSSKALSRMSIFQLLTLYLSPEEVQGTLNLYGLLSETAHGMSASYFYSSIVPFGTQTSGGVALNGGARSLCEHLLKKMEASVYIAHEIKHITKLEKDSKTKRIEIENLNTNDVLICHAQEVIVGNPAVLTQTSPKRRLIEQHITQLPGFHLYLFWKKPWWMLLGIHYVFSTASSLFNKVFFLQDGVLRIEAIGEAAVQLNKSFLESEEDATTQVLEVLTSMFKQALAKCNKDKIERPGKSYFEFKRNAQYSWKAGLGRSMTDVIKEIRSVVLDDIFVVNDAVSSFPGTMEGSLQSASFVDIYFGSGSMLWSELSAKGDEVSVKDLNAILQENPLAVEYSDTKDSTPLHKAVSLGRSDVVQLFLDHGADVNAVDNTGTTPLHIAACDGSEEICTLLIAYGADVFAKNVNETCPLDIARGTSLLKSVFSRRILIRSQNVFSDS